MMKRYVIAFAFLALAAPALASPIYVAGNTCPTNAQMGDFDRQYSVTDAVACVYDPASENIQGDLDEVLAYLGGAPWAGLGQEAGLGGIDGFSYTSDAGNDDGTLLIGSPLTSLYNQFAVGIKDGGSPKWAIFLLGIGDFESDWHFSTTGGDLSHFTLYGRVTGSQQCTTIPCGPGDDDPPTSVPDGGATVALLGASMFGLGFIRRKLQ
jgi:hypothetical protein